MLLQLLQPCSVGTTTTTTTAAAVVPHHYLYKERRSWRSGSTFVLHAVHSLFKSSVFVHANQLTFLLFSSVLQANGGMLYYCFLPDPFQFIVHELS